MLIQNEDKFQEELVSKIKAFASSLINQNDVDAIYQEMMQQLQDADLRFVLLKFLECFYLGRMDFCCAGKVRFLSLDAEKEIENGEI